MRDTDLIRLSWSLSLVQFARRLILVLALIALGGSAVRANPMLLVDMDNAQVLYEEDAGVPWHPASLTKLMTAFVAFRAIEAGRVDLNTKVFISKNAWNEAPAKSGLDVGSAITMKDALYIMIVKSANDVAVAVAETVGGTEAAFVDEMNATAVQLGLTATHFENPNGLPDPEQVTSARDLAVLALYIRQTFPQYLPIFETETVTLGKASMDTNNNLLTHFAGTTGMKTGYICASGLNIVATVERGGKRLMGVVLGGASARERGEMAAEMFLRGFSGAVQSNGKSVLQVVNQVGVPPVDMKKNLCGKQAKAYVAARAAEFPMGLKGKPSYLTDNIKGLVYAATDLGRLRNVPLPRIRPAYAPAASVALTSDVAEASIITVPQANGEIAPIPMPRRRQ
jgi:D-alanyl-D-alanine carboxypeptidase